MNLDAIELDLRPRNAWEALDLGVIMLRHWAWRVWPPFALAYVLVAALLFIPVIFDSSRLALSLIALWWLKPVFERIALHVIANGVFGSAPTTWETLRAFPRYGLNGLLSQLSIYRFDFARSFNLPVWQLERLPWRERRRRGLLLQRSNRGQAVMLTTAVVHFQSILFLAALQLVDLFIPQAANKFGGEGDDWFSFTHWLSGASESPWISLMVVATWVGVVIFSEPFYVASGFALYLNRRSHLEAWDLEVALRRLANGAKLVIAAIVAVVCTTAASPVEAASGDIQRQVEAVYKTPEFDEYKTAYFRFKDKPGEKRPKQFDIPKLSERIGSIIRALVYTALAGAALYLLYYFARTQGWTWHTRRSTAVAPPEVLFGFDLRPESLPEDVVAAARAAFARGEHRAALSLLYRAALSHVTRRDGVELKPGHTEGDARRRVAAGVESRRADYFGRLVDTWGLVAYGGQGVDPETAEGLCAGFAVSFAGTNHVA